MIKKVKRHSIQCCVCGKWIINPWVRKNDKQITCGGKCSKINARKYKKEYGKNYRNKINAIKNHEEYKKKYSKKDSHYRVSNAINYQNNKEKIKERMKEYRKKLKIKNKRRNKK
jgi:heterodisulfide reductase subunit B